VEGNKNSEINTLNMVKKAYWQFSALMTYCVEKGDRCLPKGEQGLLFRFWRAGSPPYIGRGERLSGTKVDLPFLEIDLQDSDAKACAGLIDFS